MDAYDRTIDRLFRLDARRAWDLKLESVRAVLARLGDPQDALATIHVAGTNGKGSTAATAAAVLSASGRRTALYTSPHLVDFRERIRIDDRWISREEVVAAVEEVEHAADAAKVTLTFFELTTVLAFLWFARQGVDAAVVEVGLGGRLDATNVLHPRVAVITTIGFDHEQFLGETIEAIAGEKAGILKAGAPAVCGRLGRRALETVAGRARELGIPLTRLGFDFHVDLGYEAMTWCGARRIPGFRPALEGRHQLDNAAVAIAALETGGFLDGVDDAVVRRGLGDVRWPGRLERIGRDPEILLDGAHNPDGIDALAAVLATSGDPRRTRVVFGVLADKRWGEMAERLAAVADEVVVVPVAERRSSDPEEVARAFRGVVRVATADSVRTALDAWIDDPAGRDARLVVCGSLFVVGEARARLAERGLLLR